MNEQIEKSISSFHSLIDAAENFAATFGDKIPEGLGYLTFSHENYASFSVHLSCHPPSQVERALLTMADLFGRNDWKGNVNYDRTGYDWSKVVCGVVVTIYGAEKMPPIPPVFDVPASKFPIQLEDTKS